MLGNPRKWTTLNHKYCLFHSCNLGGVAGIWQLERMVVLELIFEPASSLLMSKFLWGHYTVATNQASWIQGQLGKHSGINGLRIYGRTIPPLERV